MDLQLKELFVRLVYAVVSLQILVACSPTKGPALQTENSVPVNGIYISDPYLESRKIIAFVNSRQYNNAYIQIKTWAQDKSNIGKLFQSEAITLTALETLAWVGDKELFSSVANFSPAQTQVIIGLRKISELNFELLNSYYRCVYKPDRQSKIGCDKQAQALTILAPAYASFWR
jgi:hypothetical protein